MLANYTQWPKCDVDKYLLFEELGAFIWMFLAFSTRLLLGFERAFKHKHKLNKAATLLPLLKSWLSARIASTAIGLHASRERRTGFGCETSRGCRRRRLRCTGRASGSRRRRRAAGSRRKLSPLITSDALEMSILTSRSDGFEGMMRTGVSAGLSGIYR